MKVPAYSLLKITAWSYVPVIITILAIIAIRANDIAREANDAGLGEGFFNPTTPEQAIIAGSIIWIIGAFLIALLAVLLYHALYTRLQLPPYLFPIITVALAVLLSVGLFVTGNPFAIEGTLFVFTCAIGFGILVPLLYGYERDRITYG